LSRARGLRFLFVLAWHLISLGRRIASPVFTTSCDVCHKTLAFRVPMSSCIPAPRQPIPAITPGFCFLGHPTRLWLTVGCLLRHGRRATEGYSVPERPFDVTLGWHFTPGSLCEWRDDQCASSPRNLVLLNPAYQPLEKTGWFCMTTPQCAFTCVIHSHLLGASLRRLEVYRRLSHALHRLITSRTTLGDAVT